MIKSKTYNTVAGSNFIEDPELAMTEVYLVKREGLQHDLYVSGDPNRTHSYDSPLGRIYFPIVFNSGEKVFVVFKITSPVPPDPPCVPVTLNTTTFPDAVVDTPYSFSILVSGSFPITKGSDNLPSWMSVSLGMGIMTFSGVPDTPGLDQTIQVEDITNCGDTIDINSTINVYPPTTNLYLEVLAPGSVVTSLSGFDYFTVNTFPRIASSTLSGYHGDFTASISVNIASTGGFPVNLRLQKNGIEIQTISVSGAGVQTFSSASFLESDELKIILN